MPSILVALVLILGVPVASDAPAGDRQSHGHAEAISPPVVIRDQPGWPVVFELHRGATYTVRRPIGDGTVERTVRLISVAESWEPDRWIEGNERRETLRQAEVVVDVDGERATLLARPFQLPAVVNGLRLYVEATRTWAERAHIAHLPWRGGDVRLSAVAEGEPWGPESLRFPIGDYCWHSSSYHNTWLALVPYNKLYYHRGEDFGAIPGRLPVVAMTGGTVVESPLPDGDDGSNSLVIEAPSGMRVRYAHMDTEAIDPALAVGTGVEAGRVLGRTGMTWDGRKSQVNDHHLHVELQSGGTMLGTYPFMVEAYLRDYGDPVLAVAGGYHFGLPGQTIRLDGSRSIARPGEEIVEYTWRLHDGREVYGPVAEVRYDEPGLYSETLIVRTGDGAEDRDFAQVRIYDPERGRRIAYGWSYHTPVRGVRPGDEVTFEGRLVNTAGDVRIDFGDGTPPEVIEGIAHHAYLEPGLYEVVLRATGPGEEPVEVRLRVVVEGQ